VVPKVRVELTRGHPHRFSSLMQSVLSNAIRNDYARLLQFYRLQIYTWMLPTTV